MPVFTSLELDPTQPPLQAADLDWNVIKRPLYTHANDGRFDLTGTYGLFREDTEEFISSVTKRYIPFQNKAIVNFFDDFTNKSGGTITHGGHFKHRDIVLFGSLNNTTNLGNGNDADFSIMARTGHYPGAALEILIGVIMVACTNQFTPTYDIGSKGFYYQWHNTQFNALTQQEISTALTHMKDFISHFKTLSNVLMANIVTNEFALKFLIENIGFVNKPLDAQPKAINRIMDIFNSTAFLGPNDDTTPTAWRFWNSITQYIDYNPGKRGPRSALIGSGQDIKQQSFNNLLRHFA